MYAIIQPIEPFDATLGTTIKFIWSGNRIKSVRCIIKDNLTGDVIPTTEVETMKSEFEVPPNILINGKTYVAYIVVTDINGTQSSMQNMGTLFYCFSTPTFRLSVSDGDIISASSVPVELIYEQVENEELDEYTIRLLSYSKTPIQSPYS